MDHVQERLEERTTPATAELAYDLLRDPVLLAKQLHGVFQVRESAVPERLALSLNAQPDPPLLLVSREGRGITCLAPGMLVDVPVLAFTTTEALAQGQRQALRRHMAARRLDRWDEEGFDLQHAWRHPYNLTPEGFLKLRLLAPLLVKAVQRAVKQWGEQLALWGTRPLVHFHKMEEPVAGALWQLESRAAVGVMAVAHEPRVGLLLGDALALPDALVSGRALWALTNRPPLLLELARDTFRTVPTRAFWWGGFMLGVVASRFQAFRQEALELRDEMAAAALKRSHDPSLARFPVPALRQRLREHLLVELPQLMWNRWSEHTFALLQDAGELARLQRVAKDSTQSLEERVAAMPEELRAVFTALDVDRDLEVLPSPLLRSAQDLGPTEVERVLLWNTVLQDQAYPTGGFRELPMLLLSLLPQEALVPLEDRLPLWSRSNGRKYVSYLLPMILGVGERRAPARTAPSPAPAARPNEPCPCGSGKKFKKCCGVPA